MDAGRSVSNWYGCYVSVDGMSLNPAKFDADTVSQLRSPDDNLGFTVHFTWYKSQYAMVVIRLVAGGVPNLEDDQAGAITIKAVSIKSCNNRPHVGQSGSFRTAGELQ